MVVAALRRFEVVDRPTARSLHERSTPRGGGLAPAVTALVVAGVLLDGGPVRRALLLGGAAFALLGLLEDVRGISVRTRLAVQVVLAAATLAVLYRHDPPGLLLVLVAVVWVVSVVNAVNFMDGINGISGVHAAACGTAWWLLARDDAPAVARAGAVLAFAFVGFLPVNFPTARTFPGDVGSYFLGAWCGLLVLAGIRGGVPADAMAAPLALYLADTGSTLVWRLRQGSGWREPHRDHAFQRLAGEWGHTRVTTLVGGATLLCGAIAVAGAHRSAAARLAADAAVVAVVAAYLALPAAIGRGRSSCAS
ncbi:MAG: putative undecaprenyl-phosphate alpha-N-acetylglucosaminyl 1-phosphate transferase [Actinomycetia bacterium]|nr:putative undecaprenyl-phosphate alpha-N-acetylglucosaminyl 1-phosphate transferase [Actinomycetes bacterium]